MDAKTTLAVESAKLVIGWAIDRVKLANQEGNPILSAWVEDAEKALGELKELTPPVVYAYSPSAQVPRFGAICAKDPRCAKPMGHHGICDDIPY